MFQIAFNQGNLSGGACGIRPRDIERAVRPNGYVKITGVTISDKFDGDGLKEAL